MGKGDCYEANGRWLMDENMLGGNNLPDNVILVHAEINGQGELEGKTFGHCWLENMDTGFAFDFSNGREIYYPIQKYRDVAGVDEIRNEYRYTWEEVRKLLVSSGIWGPWELKTSSGL